MGNSSKNVIALLLSVGLMLTGGLTSFGQCEARAQVDQS